MIQRQRKLHLRIWIVVAVFLPVSAAVILSLAASTVIERAPVRFAPPENSTTGADG